MKELKKELKKENEKKVYKIGDKIEVEELETVAHGIALKGLKVIESSGNMWATRIIEGKDVDTLEDIKQTVILKLIENNYIISKECYQVINKILYNYKKSKINNVEIVINDENGNSNLDFNSYITYIKSNDYVLESESIRNKIALQELQLTKKQLEIIRIYAKLGSMQGTADILGVSKSTIQTTINRIREKTTKLINSVEY